ncbi:MAG: hypothetical protein IKW46_07520 [Bacteroidaceae bacterium]|nr:hypothetical protein [Bacteroidaceae bacterium]
MDELNAKIKGYLRIVNKNVDVIEQDNEGLIDFVIGEVADRVMLYLNSERIPSKLERVLANIVNTGLTRCLKAIEMTKEGTTDVDRAIASVSDNGQSISYANEVTRYFTTASDDELFTGFTALLSRYRRVKVVYPTHNENGNG